MPQAHICKLAEPERDVRNLNEIGKMMTFTAYKYNDESGK